MACERILVVEDTPVIMELTTVLLEMAGYVVIQAETAEGGIKVARAESPDLILMDIGLPGMDGLSATGILKQDPRTKDIPVVALTGFARKEDEGRILAAGCDGYLTKPFNIKEFSRDIACFIGSTGGVRK
jgi:CheY-like chemotaxis protein